MTRNPTVTFDTIHTQKKQENLNRMMQEAAELVLQIPNDTPRLAHCPICEEIEFQPFTDKFGFHLDKCNSCQQLFCNPMPSKAQLNCYYNSPMKVFENEFFLESYENRVPIFTRRIDIIRQHKSSGKLLDVGSAIGIFLTALERAQSTFEVHCCDPSEDACLHLKQNHPKITLHQTMIEDLGMDASFDAVTMWDTLEHIRDPLEVAAAIRRYLRPGGYWFFSTPNTRSFEWTVAGTDHVQILPPGHINLFNLESIKVMLTRSGFELVDYHTLNGTLDVSYVRKLLTEGKTEHRHNAGKFIADRISDDEFCDSLAQALVTSRQGGNLFIIARRPLD